MYYAIMLILHFSGDLLEPIPFFLTLNMHCSQFLVGSLGVVISYFCKPKHAVKSVKIKKLFKRSHFTLVRTKYQKGGWTFYLLVF